MLLGIDVLVHLHQQAMSAADLAGVLGAGVDEVQRVLDRLEREGHVNAAPAGFEGSDTWVSYYLMTPQGKDLFGKVCDRFAHELLAQPSMLPLDRLGFALVDDLAPAPREQLLRSLEHEPTQGIGAAREPGRV